MSYLHDLGIVCSLGKDKLSVIDSLLNHPENEYLTAWQQAVDSEKQFICGQATVSQTELPNLSEFSSKYQSRNNQLAMLAYQQISPTLFSLTKHSTPARIAVVIGTSTSGIKEGEQAKACLNSDNQWPQDYHYHMQEMVSPAEFLAKVSGAKGPVYSISTACSSSAKAMASAQALLEADLADIVICGGVDTLSHLPNNGFNSLESIASQYCNPLSAERDGINIGEGAALFVMAKQPAEIKLCGVGETSDAHHISAPHPSGEGAQAAMQKALEHASLSPSDIDYINLHGTATIKNDEMEALAVHSLFGAKVPCSSTKRFTGHTLGAAGAIESAILWLLLSNFNKTCALPVNKSDFGIDAKLANISTVKNQTNIKLRYCLSNSFAFGGNNISVIIGKS
ncbi:beta-ketoacyl-ACP synthase [Thalassotalea sp. PLHSN55]|uniref:beta-ketoacyl-ACP synthase n=1 Tax=Thalassotalea sp. PLHSN55 TaxID=3435888 RepID=UPI003F859B72